MDDTMVRSAVFSPDRVYRYTLFRRWEELAFNHTDTVTFIGLNPSTADETIDDPTVRRCIGYAKRWGFGALFMANLFGYRTTRPVHLREQEDPEGPGNLQHLLAACGVSDRVVMAWGVNGDYRRQDEKVIAAVLADGHDLWAIALTNDAMPRHPLYLKADLEPFVMWRA